MNTSMTFIANHRCDVINTYSHKSEHKDGRCDKISTYFYREKNVHVCTAHMHAIKRSPRPIKFVEQSTW